MNISHENQIDQGARPASRSSGRTARKAWCSTRVNARRPECRCSSIRARACRCSRARSSMVPRARRLRRGERLRRQDARGASTGAIARETCANDVKALVYTLGAKGSVILAGGETPRDPERSSRKRSWIRPAAATPIAPGCSTASRTAGTGRATGRLGSLMGAIKIAQRGAQNHAPSRDEIEARFRRAFGYSPWKSEPRAFADLRGVFVAAFRAAGFSPAR